MGGRKTGAAFLLLLLGVFYTHNLPCEVFTSYAPRHAALKWSPAHEQGPLLFWGKPTAKRDHVKVRYVGADAGFPAPILFINPYVGLHVARDLTCRERRLAKTSEKWAIALRGPPNSLA